jgi:outer membrane lipoprotein-sorting protein
VKRLWSLSSLLSHMRCRAKKRVRKARGAADIANIGKPSNAADALFGSNPKGRERFGSGSALLGLAIGSLLPRPRALNRTQIAPRRMRESKLDRLLATAFLLAVVVTTQAAFAAEPALADVMRQLAAVPSARARFTETKQVALLKTPLVLTGTLRYERPNQLEKHVLTPYDERIAIVGNEVSVENKTRGRTQNLSAASNSTLQALVESLRATLAGDLASLERHFDVVFEGNAGEWAIVLVPRDAGTLALITRIRLAGTGDRLHRIDIDEAGGDRSEMSIQDERR